MRVVACLRHCGCHELCGKPHVISLGWTELRNKLSLWQRPDNMVCRKLQGVNLAQRSVTREELLFASVLEFQSISWEKLH